MPEILSLATMLNPYTNDNTAFSWLIPICIVSLIAVIILIVIGRKRKK